MKHWDSANEFIMELPESTMNEGIYVQDDDDTSCVRIGVGSISIYERALIRNEVEQLRDVLTRWLETHKE